MRIEDGLKLDFADVLIRPKRSSLASRNDVNVERKISFRHGVKNWAGFPLVASNMDTTGTIAMAKEFKKVSALTALHKYHSINEIAGAFKSEVSDNVFLTTGTTEDDYAKLKAVKAKAPVGKICLDVANGYTEAFVSYLKKIREENPHAVIMAGNVVTGDMVEALVLAGADIVKVGIGSGSVCTTRRVTGVGYPQLSAIIECADAAHGLGAHICSDGGCTTPGDVAKAFGGGADFVMLGGMLAGHSECGGEFIYKKSRGKRRPVAMRFYGMSSETAMKKYAGGVAAYRASEGKTVDVPFRGAVADTLSELIGGVRSAMTYIGAKSLKEVPKRTTFVQVARQLNTVFGS